MTVYVDDVFIQARVGRVNGRWCHLWTDQDDQTELHELARRIGLRRSWFQQKPDWPVWKWHYDVTESRRTAAVLAGAVEIGWRDGGQQRRDRAARAAAAPSGGRDDQGARPFQLPTEEDDDPGLNELLRHLMARCCSKHGYCGLPCPHGDHVLEAHELRAVMDVARAGLPFGREQLRCELLNFTGSKRSQFCDPDTPEFHAARLLETAYEHGNSLQRVTGVSEITGPRPGRGDGQ